MLADMQLYYLDINLNTMPCAELLFIAGQLRS